MKVVIIVAASLVALLFTVVAVVALIGLSLPREHVASRSILLRKTPAEVYGVVRDFSSALAALPQHIAVSLWLTGQRSK